MQFTEEQLALRDTVRRMVQKDIAPIAAEIDETDRFPHEVVKLFGRMGLMQLWVPEEYGGPGASLGTVCMVREEISRGLAYLEREGAIKVSPDVVVIEDMGRLEAIAYESRRS